MAPCTGLRRSPRFRTCTMAGLALFPVINLYLLLTAKDCLLKADIDGRAHICTAHRIVRRTRSRSASATEQIAEQIAENICSAESVIESAVASLLERGEAELIILLPLLRIGKNRICFRSLLEFLGRFLARIHIRMIFLSQFSICFLELGIIGVLTDAKHLIVISLICHKSPLMNLSYAYSAVKERLPLLSGSLFHSAYYEIIPLYNLHQQHRHLRPGCRRYKHRPAVPDLPAVSAHTSLRKVSERNSSACP